MKLKIKDPTFSALMSTGLVPDSMADLLKDNLRDLEMKIPLFMKREQYIRKFGYCLLNENLINILSSRFQTDKILEIGAGSGFLASLLQAKNLNVIPIDAAITKNEYKFTHSFTKIEELKIEHTIPYDYDTIILSWPNYDTDFAYNVLNAMAPNKTLIYIGEQYGCTADDNFFKLLDSKCLLQRDITAQLQEHSQQWPGIHDNWYVYKTKYKK